jgi:hypothetical protein
VRLQDVQGCHDLIQPLYRISGLIGLELIQDALEVVGDLGCQLDASHRPGYRAGGLVGRDAVAASPASRRVR